MNFNFRLLCLLLPFCAFLTSCKKEDPKPNIPPTANAGNPQIIQLPANLVSMTGTGTSTNGPIVGYLWSIVSGPNVPKIANESSATASVSGLIAGTYVFQFAVVDNTGLTGIDTTSMLVKPALQQTITLQPANNALEGHVDSYNGTGGAGDLSIQIGSWTINGSSTNWRSYIKFDQSAIPQGAVIISAVLNLYSMPSPSIGTEAQSGTANQFYVERITGPWSANLNYSSLPSTTTTNNVLVPKSVLATENATIDVTQIVTDMQVSGNYGFGFRLQNETYYNMRQYASSFYSNASLRPKLVVTYQ